MKWFQKPFGAACLMLFVFNTPAMVLHVDLNSANPVPPYADWSTAATNIQDAIDAANPGDCVLVTNGIYQTGGRVVYGVVTNRIVIDKAVTVQSINGPSASVIAGSGTYPSLGIRCAYLTNGAILNGFTLTSGNAFTGIGTNYGGGVWCESISATISNCVFIQNRALNGGAVYQGTLNNCTITSNTAVSIGGGTYDAVLNDCIISGNQAPALSEPSVFGQSATYNYGGGTYNSVLNNCVVSNNFAGNGGGTFFGVVSNTIISSNTAYFGGGAYSNTLINCTLIENQATNPPNMYSSGGGGAYCSSLTHCTVISNSAPQDGGGGIFGGTLNNCLLVGNSAGDGGAVLSDQTVPPAILNNCTIYGNSALYIGGGLVSDNDAPGQSELNFTNLFVTNCIIFGNSVAPGGFPPGNSNYTNYTPAIIFDHCCTTPLPAGFGNITNDPAFVDAANGDFHLQSNSPCINAGNNAAVIGSTDFDGNPRIAGGTVDIGAYEYQTPTSIISYAWLQQYSLPTDGSADFLDSDGDGLNNWQEWRAGTSPTDASSLLQMFSPAPTNNSSGITISWQSVSGINYFVQRGSDLSAQPPFSTIQSNVVGQTGTTSYTDTTATNGGSFFYRVGVQ